MVELWAPIITTVGALVGSFGGYVLAAFSQRRAEDRKDARDREASAESRALQLEDERHDFQLKTLMALQDLVRRITRNTLLVIEQDRQTIKRLGTYHQIPETLDTDAFETGIEFALHVARVTDDALRRELEAFRSLCGAHELPPGDRASLASLTKDEMLRVQAERFTELVTVADAVTASLGARLRAEIDREGALRTARPDPI